jgi:demethylspheroidene O-methyltransferase
VNPPEHALTAKVPALATERARTPHAAQPAHELGAAAIAHPSAWHERIRDRWNALVATDKFQRWSARFPLTRAVTMRRSRALFDIVSGFVYTQTLLACVELDLFAYLAGGARTLDEIAEKTNLSRASTERLLNAAVSLRLMMKRRHGRYALGALGAPLVGNTGVLALIRHHRMAYQDLSDPVSLLRQGSDFRTELSRYWSYADAPRPQQIDGTRVAAYSEIMADTLPTTCRSIPACSTSAVVRACSCHSSVTDTPTCNCACSTCRPWPPGRKRGSARPGSPIAWTATGATSTPMRSPPAPT